MHVRSSSSSISTSMIKNRVQMIICLLKLGLSMKRVVQGKTVVLEPGLVKPCKKVHICS